MTDLEREAAEQLRALTEPPAVGDPVARVLARAARQDRRRRWSAVAAAFVATAVVVLGAQALPEREAAPPAEGQVVPWRFQLADAESSTGVRDPSPSGEPACTSRQVEVTASEAVISQRAGQQDVVEVPVRIRNGGARCQLDPEADLVPTDASGAPLPPATSVRTGPLYFPPPPLESGASASATMRWSSWCGSDPGDWRVSVQLPGGAVGAGVPGIASPPPCTAAGAGAIAGGGLWELLNEYDQPLRDPREALRGTLEAPARAKLGETLRMVLRLENPSRGPVRLDPCPTLGWAMDKNPQPGLTATHAVFRLNCQDAPDAIPEGGSLSFELQLILSPALSDGALAPGRWSLRAGTVGNPEPVQVEIEAPEPATTSDRVTCLYVPTGGAPRVPGLPAAEGPSVPAATPRGQAVLDTDRGEVVVQLDPQLSPCAVRAFVHHVEGGYWDRQPCFGVSREARFQNADCGSQEFFYGSRAGFRFPAETTVGMDYPAGTVVLTDNDAWTNAGTLRVLTGAAPTYADNFTVLGRVVAGLDVVAGSVAAGPKPGTYQEPVLPLTIRSVALR